jgi:hypothetical protein
VYSGPEHRRCNRATVTNLLRRLDGSVSERASWW